MKTFIRRMLKGLVYIVGLGSYLNLLVYFPLPTLIGTVVGFILFCLHIKQQIKNLTK